MSNDSRSLPRFRNPPVIETVLGVFFRPLEKFTSAHLGILWDRCFREKFPTLQERPPVEEIAEQFGEARSAAFPMVRWQVTDQPDTPRLWATSASKQHVVQIQKNAFFSNWLKTANDTAYQGYDERRHEFKNQLDHLADFLTEQDIGRMEPTSWTVTYINHIHYTGMERVGPEAARTLSVWTNQFSDDFLREPDKLALSFAFPMPEDSGRLNVNLTPVTLQKKQQALRLDLTARGQLKNKDISSALTAIDLGHEWVVRGFASLTRSEMHMVWGKD